MMNWTYIFVAFENTKKFDFAQGAMSELSALENVLDFFDRHLLELALCTFLPAILLLVTEAKARILGHESFEHHRSTPKAN